VVCSELIADLGEKNLEGAPHPILLYEMAHSLMYLWKLPGYNNEDIADEFATIYLAKVFPHTIESILV
jgi:hypothetical protein